MRRAGCLLRLVGAAYMRKSVSSTYLLPLEASYGRFLRQQLRQLSDATTGQVGSTSNWDVGNPPAEGENGENRPPENTPAPSLQKETSTRDLINAKAKELKEAKDLPSPEGNHDVYGMVREDEGTSVWALGMKVTVKCCERQTNGAYTLLEYMLAPGDGSQMHTHTREDETWYMLDGEMEWTLGDKTYQAKRGCFMHLPSGMPHRVHNNLRDSARMLVYCLPGGIEEYFMEIGVAVDPNPHAVRPSISEEEAHRATHTGRKYGLTFEGLGRH